VWQNIAMLKIFCLLAISISFPLAHGVELDFFSQTVHLKKFNNIVTQNRFRVLQNNSQYDLYAGIWWDEDQRTNDREAFTDSQFSPLIGVQSRVYGNEWIYSRLFLEGRQINRLGDFPDDRERATYDIRAGLIGSGLKSWDLFFFENYYAFFYTRLYGERFIFQGWSKQGMRFLNHFDVFNEFLGDTFDLTRDTDSTFDARPGIRLEYRMSGLTIQLLHQWIYHFSNIELSGRSEQRSTLVIAAEI